jgi:hypothetical protein
VKSAQYAAVTVSAVTVVLIVASLATRLWAAIAVSLPF